MSADTRYNCCTDDNIYTCDLVYVEVLVKTAGGTQQALMLPAVVMNHKIASSGGPFHGKCVCNVMLMNSSTLLVLTTNQLYRKECCLDMRKD